MEIQVSIIIVNYNTEKVIEDCISSVINNTKDVSYEIIVVDNNSEEGSLSRLMTVFPQVNFQLEKKNHGFGVGNNIGASVAKGKYLYLLNPDAVLANDAVSILYNYMENHPQTGICGGSMYNLDGTRASSYCDMDLLRMEYEILFNIRKNYRGIAYDDSKPKTVSFISGANIFISKKIFDEVGGFDKDFFMYFEELELCDRVRKKGYLVVSVPTTKIIHLHGASAENKNDELNKWSRVEHWYSKFIYFYKTNGKTQVRILHLAHICKFRLAVFLYGLQGNKKKLNYWNSKKLYMEEAYIRYKKYANK